MDSAIAPRKRRLAVRVTVAAFVWSLGLLVAAVLVPVYSQTEASQSGPTLTTATLVEVNGPRVLIPVALPVVLCAVAAIALRRKCMRGGRRSSAIAWGATGLLAAFALLAILSIGVFVVPVVLLLAWAAALTPSGGNVAPAAASAAGRVSGRRQSRL